MGTLDYQSKTTTHIKPKKQNLTFKMYTFEPQYVFHCEHHDERPRIQKTCSEFHTHYGRGEKSKNPLPKIQVLLKLPKNRVLLLKPKIVPKPKIRPPAQCFHPECAIQGKTSKKRHQILFQFH